jgi:hypothetical protein
MQVFTLWFQMIKTEDKYFRRLYDKKLCCAGLLCIFNLPSTNVPPAISAALDKVCCWCHVEPSATTCTSIPAFKPQKYSELAGFGG